MTALATYEQRLKADPRWALTEGSMHFDKENSVFRSLERITRRLDGLGIPYAVVGGMALFQHGYRRFTEDVDLLVTRDGLKVIHEKLVGLGYLPPFETSKNLRDTDTGVRIEFLVAGDYPGDGQPKPVSFPDPSDASEMVGGVRCLKLPTLVELKLTSGMAPWRLKDLGDVQQMIRTLDLPLELAEQLNPFVQESYRELWRQVQAAPRE
jgi:hypothetical protein